MSKFKQLENALQERYPDYNLIFSMLKLNKVSYDQQNENGDTILHLLLKYLSEDHLLYDNIIMYIIENMTNLDIQNNKGKTCLHIVCETRYKIKYVEEICKKMENVNIPDRRGSIPLYYTLISRKYDFINLLIDKIDNNYQDEYAKDTLLHIALYMDLPLDILMKFLIKTSEINIKNIQGNTILHSALEYLNTDFIKILLEYPGIDYDIINKNNELPLHLLICNRYNNELPIEIIQILVERTTNINLENKDGNTALNLAIIYNKPEFIRILLHRDDINYNLVNNKNETLVHLLADSRMRINDNLDIYIHIIKRMENIFSLNKFNETFLHVALHNRYVDFLNIILNYLRDNMYSIPPSHQFYVNFAIHYLTSIFSPEIYSPILINLIKLGLKNNSNSMIYSPSKLYNVKPDVKKILIYYDNFLTFEEVPTLIQLSREETESIIAERKQEIFLHPSIQREIGKDLLIYVDHMKQKFKSSRPNITYKSSHVLNNRVWLRHILRFSKYNSERFFSKNKDTNFIHLL